MNNRKSLLRIAILSVLACVGLVVTLTSTTTVYAQQRTFTPTPVSQSEEEMYASFVCMNATSYEAFLEAYPDSESAPEVNIMLELSEQVDQIEGGDVEPQFVIEFELLGSLWQQWTRINDTVGSLGYILDQNTLSVGILPGCGGVISFDSRGNVVPSTGNGSIIFFETNNLEFGFLGDISIQAPVGERLYFTVLDEFGLVYLQGEGEVTMPNGDMVELPLASPEETPDSSSGSIVGLIQRSDTDDPPTNVTSVILIDASTEGFPSLLFNKRTAEVEMGEDGSFAFRDVEPGTYILALIGTMRQSQSQGLPRFCGNNAILMGNWAMLQVSQQSGPIEVITTNMTFEDRITVAAGENLEFNFVVPCE